MIRVLPWLMVFTLSGVSGADAAKASKKKEPKEPPGIEMTDVDLTSQKPLTAARISVFGVRLGDPVKKVLAACSPCVLNKADHSVAREGVLYRLDAKGRVEEIRLFMSFAPNALGETRRWFTTDFANDQTERADALQSETAVRIKETSIMGKGLSETHTLVFGDTGLELNALKASGDQLIPQFIALKFPASGPR